MTTWSCIRLGPHWPIITKLYSWPVFMLSKYNKNLMNFHVTVSLFVPLPIGQFASNLEQTIWLTFQTSVLNLVLIAFTLEKIYSVLSEKKLFVITSRFFGVAKFFWELLIRSVRRLYVQGWWSINPRSSKVSFPVFCYFAEKKA